MKTRDYWKQREREAKQRQATMRRLDSYNREIERIYKSTLDSIQKEIDAFYGKYAMDTDMTISEAKKRASKLDIEAYGRKAKQYVKERNFSDIANAEMKLYNMTMKVNRLELLKANIGLEMVKNFDELDKFYKDTLTNETIKELRRMSSILGDSVIDTDKANKRYSQAAERIAGASFHNATFSDRVWMHQDLLKHEIDMSLQRALISGTSMQRLASDLRKKFGVSQKNAERLMRTEIRRMQTDAAMESYKRNGNEKYEFMALGQHPCEICSALDGKVYKVEKMEVGLNAPPMHPNCMCSTAPHVDEKAYQESLGLSDANITKGLQNQGERAIVKNIDMDDLEVVAHGRDIDARVIETIGRIVSASGKGYHYDDVIVKGLGQEETLMQTEAYPAGKIAGVRLIINQDAVEGRTLEQVNERVRISTTTVATNLEEAAIHETGHAKHFYRKSAEQIEKEIKVLQDIHIGGINRIAYSDASELIAEVEVLLYQGEIVPDEAMKIYNKYVGEKK